MLNITLNNEKNGIEVRFDSKPNSEVLDVLKGNGFRWSNRQKMWYAKQSDDRMSLLNSLDCGSSCSDSNTKKKEYNLFELTRTNNIENHYEKDHLLNTKEIAAIIRKHLRNRFPMIRWSVTSDYNSVDVYIKESPFDKESEELKAIVTYACKYVESYNYDNSDYMTDYHDVNFYSNISYADGHTSYALHYDYKQRDMTISELNISEKFQEDLEVWKEMEIEKEAVRLEELKVKMEAERKLAEEYRIQKEKDVELIESNVEIKEVDYTIENCFTSGSGAGSLEALENEIRSGEFEIRYEDCKVAREVHMSEEVYETFTKYLVTDFSFLSGMGGSATDDVRISSMDDYHRMSESERKTVKFYNTDCVAIVVDGEIRLVIDPQGFDYARYVYFLPEGYNKVSDYKGDTGVSKEEEQKLDELTDRIIREYKQITAFDDDQIDYSDLNKGILKEFIYENHFPMTESVIGHIPEEYQTLKALLYDVLKEINSLQSKFQRSGLVSGQKFTLFHIGDFGWCNPQSGIFKEFTCGKYAQYNDAVKLIYRPERKRSDYYQWLHGEILIYEGYLELPDDILYEVSEHGNFVTKKSRYSSFDHAQYDAVINYFRNLGLEPLINTCN